MASRDLLNNIDVKVALAPVVVADGTAQKTVAIDTLGYESVTFVVLCGTLADADATWTLDLREGDTSTQTNHTAAAADDMIGTEALGAIDFSMDGKAKKIGYKGGKRYVSLEINNVVANTGNAPLAVLAILGHPKSRPTANPPA